MHCKSMNHLGTWEMTRERGHHVFILLTQYPRKNLIRSSLALAKGVGQLQAGTSHLTLEPLFYFSMFLQGQIGKYEKYACQPTVSRDCYLETVSPQNDVKMWAVNHLLWFCRPFQALCSPLLAGQTFTL